VGHDDGLADDPKPPVLSAVTSISIRDLNALPSQCEAGPDRRIYAEEFRVFEVVGRVTYIAHEDDRDYHLALEDPNATGSTVVTELADTLCRSLNLPAPRDASECRGNVRKPVGGDALPRHLLEQL
jgi:hypothetical protein